MVLTTLLTLSTFLPAGPGTEPHPLVGAWTVDFPGGMRIQNGVSTPIRLIGRLTVEAQGDSLIGILVTDPSTQASRPPLRLAAKAASGNVAFVSRSPVTVNINGAEQQGVAVATWTLGATGDQLEGTVDRKLEGVDGPPLQPQPVTGKRLTKG